MADDPKKKADDAKKSLEEIGEITGALEEGFRALTSRLSDIVDEIKDASSETRAWDLIYKDTSRSVKSLSKITEDLVKNQVKINEKSISSKEIQTQINKKIAEQQVLTTRIASLQKQLSEDASISEDKRIEKQNLINHLQQDFKELSFNAIEPLKEQQKIVEGTEKALEETNKKLGIFGGVLKGIGKIPILGDLVDTKSALEAAMDATDKTGSGLKGLKAGLGNLKGQVTSSLTNPANIALFVITQIIEALKLSDAATGDLAKSFNITYDNAAALRNELIQIGNESGNIALNARALQESMIAVGQSLGSNARLNTEDLKTFTELREMAGYTNEELVGIQKLTLATGGNLKDNTKQFLGTVAALNAQNKLTVNEKQLLKEVANTSAAIKLSVGGTTEGLAKAAFQAKKFGINLEQADKIASSLLDFESSISNELEAELLTGKDLNLERARLLALNGDIAGASAEILKQVKGSAEFTKMNRIQQESLAKAVGMGREELAASLIEREALNKLGVKDAAAAKEKFDLLVKEKGYAAAVAEMGDEQYANQLKQQSIQERMNKSVEKMKELFVSIAEPILEILSPLMDLVTAVLPPILGLLQPVLGAFKAIAHTVAGIVKLLTFDFKGSMESFGSIGSDLLGGVTSSTQFKVGKSIVSSMSDEKSESQTKFAEGGIVTKEINNATIGEAGLEAVIPLNSPKADRYLGGNNTNNNPISNNINSNVDVKVSAGNTVVQLDGVAIAKAITKYVVDEINKNGVVIA